MKDAYLRYSRSKTTKPLLMGLITLALASSQITSAAEQGWYLGANLGLSDADMDSDSLIDRQRADGFNNIRLQNDDDAVGFKIYSGYQLNQYIALEGGYFDLGAFSYRAFTTPYGVYTSENMLRGVSMDLVALIPMTDRLNAIGRFGATRYQSEYTNRGYGAVSVNPFNSKSRESGHKMGLGLEYTVSNNLGLRLEAERYDIEDAMFRNTDVDMVSFGLVYRFAQPAVAATPATPVSVAPPRPVVAPAPAPEPALAPTPVRVSLSADSLFGFDSATVTPAGRAELDRLVADLRGLDYDSIAVTGHTDRLGAQAHNLALSTRRAVAVKDYLVESARIPAARITTRGVNGADPVTTVAQCGNQLARTQLIACLAPDRRVEVEVTGSRPR